MNKPRILVKLLCFTILVTLWAGVEPSHAGQFRNWRNLGAADLPARVRAIKFTHLLDADHSVRWGAWTVEFGSELPVATMTNGLNISDLLCSNRVVGEKKCRFYLIDDRDFGLDCSLFIGTDPVTRIEINCPQGINLEY